MGSFVFMHTTRLPCDSPHKGVVVEFSCGSASEVLLGKRGRDSGGNGAGVPPDNMEKEEWYQCFHMSR